MKINKFYLNRLAEAKVENMSYMFSTSDFGEEYKVDSYGHHISFKRSLGAWDIKNPEEVFIKSKYTPEKYLEDREIHLKFLLSKEEKYKKDREDSLNKEIVLDSLELDF